MRVASSSWIISLLRKKKSWGSGPRSLPSAILLRQRGAGEPQLRRTPRVGRVGAGGAVPLTPGQGDRSHRSGLWRDPLRRRGRAQAPRRLGLRRAAGLPPGSGRSGAGIGELARLKTKRSCWAAFHLLLDYDLILVWFLLHLLATGWWASTSFRFSVSSRFSSKDRLFPKKICTVNPFSSAKYDLHISNIWIFLGLNFNIRPFQIAMLVVETNLLILTFFGYFNVDSSNMPFS